MIEYLAGVIHDRLIALTGPVSEDDPPETEEIEDVRVIRPGGYLVIRVKTRTGLYAITVSKLD